LTLDLDSDLENADLENDSDPDRGLTPTVLLLVGVAASSSWTAYLVEIEWLLLLRWNKRLTFKAVKP
jgi:hypothetical protein